MGKDIQKQSNTQTRIKGVTANRAQHKEPTATRTTACVSSQVGCSLDCKFCATARLKRMRNLNPDEIYDQVVAIDRESRLYHNRPLSNIVFIFYFFNYFIISIDTIFYPL